MEDQSVPYTLLACYFSKQASPIQQEEVEKWRRASSEHEALFLSLKEQWESVHASASSIVIPNKNAVWNQIQKRIKAKQIPLYTRSLLIKVAGIAAAVACVVGFSLAALWNETADKRGIGQSENIVMAPYGQKSQLILPDGTQVWLNSGSRLSYSYQYNTKARTVNLVGEAFFDVKENKAYPFIVKTGKVDVKVHGTAFNVQAYENENNIAVALLRGKVSLLSSADHQLLTYLSPGQSAIVSKQTGKWRVVSCDAETESSWHLNLLKFEGASTEEIWKKLGRWYGVEVKLQNVSPLNTYWFTVKTETLTEMLVMINKLTPIDYTINGKEVTVKYK